MRNWGEHVKAWVTPGRGKALAVAVVAAGLAVALARYAGGPKLFLDYVKVLVWPLTLAISAWWLRDVLRDKLRQLYEVAFPGGAAAKFREAERVDAEASSETAPAAHLLLQTKHLPEAESRAGDAGPEQVNGHPAAEAQDELARQAREREQRKAFEKTFREGADWGWKMSQIGFKTAPVPHIVWSGNTPHITHEVGSRPRQSVRALVAEIQAIEDRLNQGQSFLVGDPYEELARLRAQLRALEPLHPLGLEALIRDPRLGGSPRNS
ncbi:hypothetical protein [Actinopolymorpha pittospori]|uniref:Uncharacterized protein n=1 Tax=Actinopolymorpha pittospori TaxID=648752 RepID=A0A927R835_9ACTN|nr:hypothetical protein [Actinopolymorpha pittospori]MBE1606257.1 hypothetical protein [Actinopolymorpha pittospori]